MTIPNYRAAFDARRGICLHFGRQGVQMARQYRWLGLGGNWFVRFTELLVRVFVPAGSQAARFVELWSR